MLIPFVARDLMYLLSLVTPLLEVPSWYVRCPLHGTGSRSCSKQIQEGQGGREKVICKLLYWLAQGLQVV